MGTVFRSLKVKWRNSTFVRTFNLKDDKAIGRTCNLTSSIFSSLAAQISGGIFYTGFLLSYGINIVNIGVITFVPVLTRLLSMFSPFILERFKKRKTILAVLSAITHLINILGITYLPTVITTEAGRVIGFTLLVTISSALAAIIDPGYLTWYAHYLPDDVRADYFTLSSGINSFLTQGIVLVLSLITDSFAGSPRQLEIIVLFRHAALVIALLNILILSIPKEAPYERSKSKIKVSDIFTLPFKNKKFLWTAMLVGFFYIGNSITNASINIFLLQDVGISYSQINFINAIYFMFFIMFGSMWKKFLKKHDWFKTFAYVMLMQAPTYFLYAFVTPGNQQWLWYLVRLLQHVLGVAANTVLASMVYVNLPKQDQTNYISFYSILTNVAVFLSMMLGTFFISFVGERTLNIFGFQMASVPMLLGITGIWQILTAVLFLKFSDALLPDERL